MAFNELRELIQTRRATVAVVGGNVAVVVAHQLVDAGFAAKRVGLGPDLHRWLAEPDVVIAAPDLQARHSSEPDLTPIIEIADALALRRGGRYFLALASTVTPGTIRSVMMPRISKGRCLGDDIFVAACPSRHRPQSSHDVHCIPIVVGGATPKCVEIATALYSAIGHDIVPVATLETAEMVAHLESAFITVNRAVANELGVLSERLGLDGREVFAAAATKPFGFMPFECDAGDFVSDDRTFSRDARPVMSLQLLALADSINTGIAKEFLRRTMAALNDRGKPINGSSILLIADSMDEHQSYGAVDGIARLLATRGARVKLIDARADGETLALAHDVDVVLCLASEVSGLRERCARASFVSVYGSTPSIGT